MGGSQTSFSPRVTLDRVQAWVRGVQQSALLDQASTRLMGKFIATHRPVSAASRSWAGGDSGSPLPSAEQALQGRRRASRRVSRT
mmetsp:Transcript_38708/g.90262  ORF Transcript_38708/g.90262 Transcript_38708/m.90262 type:complete len:85 (+) Transcript_38708:189-443(+)